MEITFPGGVAVEASFDGFTVRTDQPLSRGGENSAPTPFDLFLASLGTCTGFFAWRYCQERGLSTDGLRVTLDTAKDAHMHRLTRIIVCIARRFPINNRSDRRGNQAGKKILIRRFSLPISTSRCSITAIPPAQSQDDRRSLF